MAKQKQLLPKNPATLALVGCQSWEVQKASSEKEAKTEALADLDDFLELSKKLGKDNKEYIEECRIYYNAWFDFLDNKDKYKSYEEYLEKNNIEY